MEEGMRMWLISSSSSSSSLLSNAEKPNCHISVREGQNLALKYFVKALLWAFFSAASWRELLHHIVNSQTEGKRDKVSESKERCSPDTASSQASLSLTMKMAVMRKRKPPMTSTAELEKKEYWRDRYISQD